MTERRKQTKVDVEAVIQAVRALVDRPELSPPDVPADGGVYRRVEPVPVYWARCPDCLTGHGFPSFGEAIGRQRAGDWLENHRRAYCPAKNGNVA